jgi:hypothetical protein
MSPAGLRVRYSGHRAEAFGKLLGERFEVVDADAAVADVDIVDGPQDLDVTPRPLTLADLPLPTVFVGNYGAAAADNVKLMIGRKYG